MPTVITQGAASAKGYGFGARATAANYIEDVFSTYLYTGTGASQAITNGIDLSGKGGMVWIKSRNAINVNPVTDTVRGVSSQLRTDGITNAQDYGAFQSFNSTGFTVYTTDTTMNGSGTNYVSWTFRKQAKFFDIVTYTGNGSTTRSISHNLGSVPGFVVVKRTDSTGNWIASAYDGSSYKILKMNTTGAAFDTYSATLWTSSTFRVANYGTLTPTGNTNDDININGATYVAYLFAHDAGGFGASGSDNAISCGSFTTDGTGLASVTLGYEPQWVLIKPVSGTSGTGNWQLYDNMRGMAVGATQNVLYPNLSNAETSTSNRINLTATGFGVENSASTTFIYIAIRRGPMKTPTSGTSVYNAVTRTATNATVNTTAGFPVDLDITQGRGGLRAWWFDKLRGPNLAISSNLTNAEAVRTDQLMSFNQNGVTFGADSGGDVNGGSNTYVDWYFRRAPGFFDVVCYTGTGANRTVSHNLGVAPELMIVKPRNLAGENWIVYNSSLNTPAQNRLVLNGTFGQLTTPNATWWNSTSPTSSVFSLGTPVGVNGSSYTYVAYLFATCPGVSKVGSYTGTGTTKQIDCGFTGGARFVLIKRTDSTGDWYVWDSARGIVSGNDPYLLLNSAAAEVTNTDYIDTYAAGFEISSTAPAAINANGGSFIFLAIA